MPGWLRRDEKPSRSRGGSVASADTRIRIRSERKAPGIRRASDIQRRSALARPDSFPGVLSWRHRSRLRRIAPDRLDGFDCPGADEHEPDCACVKARMFTRLAICLWSTQVMVKGKS